MRSGRDLPTSEGFVAVSISSLRTCEGLSENGWRACSLGWRSRADPWARPLSADREDAPHARQRPVGRERAPIRDLAAIVEEEQEDLLLSRLEKLAESRLHPGAGLRSAEREGVSLLAGVEQDEA